jgi:hypothetical protein
MCLTDEHSLSQYFLYIDSLTSWFDSSFLELNVQKTKEICFEESRARDASLLRPIKIKDETVNKWKLLNTLELF